MLAAEEAAAGAWRETEHAREIAHLRDQQTRLARDVHDVVGHSLAVILAQAESGQYLDDTVKLKKTLQTIATSARSSLQDVRQVLSSTQDTTMVDGDADPFDSLIAGVRGSGHEIVATELGTPRQLPREAAAVAYRVFQEMLTNAIKHGRRDQPIVAERHWPAAQPAGGVADTLRIEVTNMTEASGHQGADAGRGLDGMRQRLEAIGGHLDVRRREQPAGITFTVTAYVPVRGGA
jgi:signal transduction histidine kinase